jgi:pyruvate kinase
MKDNQLPLKKTKIVCTLGPASNDRSVLEQMIGHGMNIARINFAHGDFEAHRQTIINVRAAAQAAGQPVAILGDLPGPKMRIGQLAEEPIDLERGQPFVLQTEEIIGNHECVSMDFEGLPKVVKTGDTIYINDGYIQLKVERVVGQAVHCTVEVGGQLRSHKGINVPGIDLGISAFTERDRELLAFAAEQKLDAVSQSFVCRPDDIGAVREAAAHLNYDPLIIAKIERASALDNIEKIVDLADGMMVARGDLGVEIPIENIPAVQKQLIQLANLAAKPIITATQMLESMTDNRRPTRAEVTDVANAILDGTDCVMLSGETAIGSYPVETVKTMAQIARATEATDMGRGIADLMELERAKDQLSRDNLVSFTVFAAARSLKPCVIFVPAESGRTARNTTRFRMAAWIVAPSQSLSTCQRLQFSYGVYPVHVPTPETLNQRDKRRSLIGAWLRRHEIDEGLVLLVERDSSFSARDTKRIDIIDLG